MSKSGLRLGCIVCLFCAMAVIGWPADTFTTLVSFYGMDGSMPGGLVQSLYGTFYGTTADGVAPFKGRGTIFRTTPSGELTTVYRFCSQPNCSDGVSPSGLLLATDGNFYGTTPADGPNGGGTFFKFTVNDKLTTLYGFCSQPDCTDGGGPGELVETPSHNFFGTTSFGGAGDDGGTFFEINRAGELTTLYSFCSQPNCTDGREAGDLVRVTNGNFYGITRVGGANDSGTIFEITPAGALTTLYSFCSQPNCTDGAVPDGLLQATDGNFYGTTNEGGVNNNGTVFKITPAGALTTLYRFCSEPNCSDGSVPISGLVQATDGNFYGTTQHGGIPGTGSGFGGGTVFEITSTGTLTTLYRFCSEPNCTDGSSPSAELLQATDGNIYGTTVAGGVYCTSDQGEGCGTIFSLATGLGPFIETLPTSGRVGGTVKILGNNLTGTTSVTFDGTPAAFKVVSGSAIMAIVPSGATTGHVVVITPSTTLTSNVNFTVF